MLLHISQRISAAFPKLTISSSGSTAFPWESRYEPKLAWGSTTPAKAALNGAILLSMKWYADRPDELHTHYMKSRSCSSKIVISVFLVVGNRGPSWPSLVKSKLVWLNHHAICTFLLFWAFHLKLLFESQHYMGCVSMILLEWLLAQSTSLRNRIFITFYYSKVISGNLMKSTSLSKKHYQKMYYLI